MSCPAGNPNGAPFGPATAGGVPAIMRKSRVNQQQGRGIGAARRLEFGVSAVMAAGGAVQMPGFSSRFLKSRCARRSVDQTMKVREASGFIALFDLYFADSVGIRPVTAY